MIRSAQSFGGCTPMKKMSNAERIDITADELKDRPAEICSQTAPAHVLRADWGCFLPRLGPCGKPRSEESWALFRNYCQRSFTDVDGQMEPRRAPPGLASAIKGDVVGLDRGETAGASILRDHEGPAKNRNDRPSPARAFPKGVRRSEEKIRPDHPRAGLGAEWTEASPVS